MGRRDSRVIDNIICINHIEGMSVKAIYDTSQRILNLYKEMDWNKELNNYSMSPEEYSLEVLLDNLKALQDYSSGYDIEDIKELYESGTLSKMIRYTVEKTRTFPRKGKDYFNCLNNTYLNHDIERVEDIIDMMHMSRGSYYDTRREALVLFGAIFWGSLIPFCIKTSKEAFSEVDRFLEICNQNYISLKSDDDINGEKE